jgi:group I intron endonuclease
MGYIYKITNIVNGKCYIGVTTKENPNERWSNHKSAIRHDRGCPFLQKAVKKYGEESFTFEVLIICFDEDVFKFENEYIVKHNTMSPNGYNVAVGGIRGPSFLGKTHSEETKQIISIKSKKYHSRPEVKEKQRQRAIEFNKQRNTSELLKKSEKWQKALAEGRIGAGGHEHGHTEEVKNKISESLKAYYKKQREEQNTSKSSVSHRPETLQKISEIMRKVNGKKVSQYTLDGQLIASYDSIVEAAEKNGFPRKNVQACVSGHSKTSGGFIWKHTELKDS